MAPYLVENLYGLNFEKFKLTLENLNKSNSAIKFYVKRNILENTKLLKKKKSTIINEIFFDQPEEIVFRSLSELIHNIGSKIRYTRGKKVISMINYNKNSYLSILLQKFIYRNINMK